MTYAREIHVAVEAVTWAAQLCAAVRSEMVEAAFLEKNDRSPVTIADYGAQALVGKSLRAAFPHDVLIAEEDSTELRRAENAAYLQQVTRFVRRFEPAATPEELCAWIDAAPHVSARRYWTLDPIDGTKGFLRNDQYAVALALVVEGQVQVGVLACPALPLNGDEPGGGYGVLFLAERSKGAFMQSLSGGAPVPIRVSDTRRITHARCVESVESGHANHELQHAIAQAVGITQPPLRMDSQAKYGAVARGDGLLYLRLPSAASPTYREKVWDHAAGALIIEEAGGRVTDMFGAPLDFSNVPTLRANRGIIASNGALHQAVVETVARHHTPLEPELHP